MNNKISVTNIIIIISFILSISLSLFYITSYDAYHLNGYSHIMLKEETYAHWYKAALIIEQIKNGTSFYLAGEQTFTKPLPQRLVALYSYIVNFNIIDNWENNKISLGGKLPFLIIQSFIYYFSVFILYTQISRYFEEKINILIIAFLCLEPTIFQYHSSFWTESFYFSIQLLLLSVMMAQKERNINYLIIGLLLGFLFTQRSAGIFYIIIISIYYFFTIKKNKYRKISLIFLPYFTICLLLGIHNYKRAGIFYVMPTEGKYSMYKYFAKNILVESKKSSISEINKSEVKKSLIWINDNMPDINYEEYLEVNSPYEIGLEIKDEKQKIKFYGYLNKRSYEILLNHPIITSKRIVSGFIHFSVLNPFFVYYDYDYYKDYLSSEIGDFVFSEQHKKLIPVRIIYTVIIFIICITGIFECFRKQPKITLLLLFSVLYYYIILGWYGKTRLFVPALIYLSVFFGSGCFHIFNKIKKKLNHN